MYSKDNDLIEVPVKICGLSSQTRTGLLNKIKKAEKAIGKQQKLIDENGASYCISREKSGEHDILIISVVDQGSLSNASALSFFEMYLGTTEKRYSKPWMFDNSKTVFFMIWNWKNLSLRGISINKN